MARPRVILPLLLALLVTAVGLRPKVVELRSARPAGQASTTPTPDWLPADKQGFGTSRTWASKVWFTLEGGELSEVYYPKLDTPSFRDLQFSVDGAAQRDAAGGRGVPLRAQVQLNYRTGR
jgi:glucoamylase